MTQKSIIASYNLLEFNFRQFWNGSKHSKKEKNGAKFSYLLPCPPVAAFFGEMNFLKDFLQLGPRLSFMNMNRLLVKLIFKANFISNVLEGNERRANGVAEFNHMQFPVPFCFISFLMQKVQNLHFSISWNRTYLFCSSALDSSSFFCVHFHMQMQWMKLFLGWIWDENEFTVMKYSRIFKQIFIFDDVPREIFFELLFMKTDFVHFTVSGNVSTISSITWVSFCGILPRLEWNSTK